MILDYRLLLAKRSSRSGLRCPNLLSPPPVALRFLRRANQHFADEGLGLLSHQHGDRVGDVGGPQHLLRVFAAAPGTEIGVYDPGQMTLTRMLWARSSSATP